MSGYWGSFSIKKFEAYHLVCLLTEKENATGNKKISNKITMNDVYLEIINVSLNLNYIFFNHCY